MAQGGVGARAVCAGEALVRARALRWRYGDDTDPRNPEEAYEVIRKRARADGRSIQSYMRDWVIDFADHPTPREVLATLGTALGSHGTPGATHKSIQTDLAADRR